LEKRGGDVVLEGGNQEEGDDNVVLKGGNQE